jgi:hypothetical protein
LFGDLFKFDDDLNNPRDLQSWAAAQNKIPLKGMDRMEFFDSVAHLKFSTYMQVRKFVDGEGATARRMKAYLLRGTQNVKNKVSTRAVFS